MKQRHVTLMPHAVDLDRLAEEIEQHVDETARRGEYHLPMPPYVQHHPDVGEIGKLSAQAVAAAFEKSAVEIEEMARELIEMSKRCDADTLEAIKQNEIVKAKIKAAVEQCERSAADFRDQAKAVFDQIQQSTLLADEVRTACIDMSGRIQRNEPKNGESSEPKTD